MRPERWRQVKAVFDAALERASPADRAAFLDGVGAGDASLRQDVESLLLYADGTESDGLQAIAAVESQTPGIANSPPNLAPAVSDGIAVDSTLSSLLSDDGGARGSYRLLQCLGEGGMGVVWLAEQIHPVRRHVAIKVIRAGMDTVHVVSRFEAERQALALMDHPGIAKVLDAGTTPEGRPYFAMEYVRGEMITTFCDRHRMTVDQRLELFGRLCDAVQHAHQKGLIHRDLKPSNILVSSSDDQPELRVIDFGIAKAIASPMANRSGLTEFGTVVGTLEYMSPEQASNSIDIDTRSDIYSLGVILYELLTGALPFDWATLREHSVDYIRETLRTQEPLRPSERVALALRGNGAAAESRATSGAKLVKRLKADLDWITMKALEPDRSRRYPTANGMALDVRRYLKHEPVSAGPPRAMYRTARFVRRHRFGVLAATTFIVLTLAFGAVTLIQARRITREAETTKQIADFLVGLFNVSDPSEARGNTLTAREILDRGAARVDSELKRQPEIQARLMSTIGNVYSRLGLFANAEPLLRRALESEQLTLGADNPNTLSTLDALAEANWREGHNEEAQRLYTELLERRRAILGDGDLATISASDSLAVVLMYEKQWPEAEKLLKRALEQEQRTLGDQHPATLTTLNNLGSLYWRQGRYAESLPFTVAAVQGRTRVLGADHPETLTSMNNLATTYDRLDRFGEAEQMYLQTIAVKTRVLGQLHSSTAGTIRWLAGMYVRQGRYDEAERRLLPTVEALLSRGPASAGSIPPSIEQLVKLYEAWGKPDRAAMWRAKISTSTQ